jgi:hypothetical protein
VITAAVITGNTTATATATAESLNRLAKLEARLAYRFRNREPAQASPHRLHPRLPAPVTHRNLRRHIQ